MKDLDKKTLRALIKKKYSEISPSDHEERSRLLFALLAESSVFKESKHILAFWSLNDEPSTHQFLKSWSREKSLYLPVIQSESLVIKPFLGEEQLKPGELAGVQEPEEGDEVPPELIDLVLVPGLAFDADNNRLGRGKGFYDRFLPRTNAYKIGICFGFQMVAHVPVDRHDVKMDEVLFV